MNENINIYNSKLSEADFKKISEFIETNYAIRLPEIKKAMVQNRLYKRLKVANFNSFEEYVKYIFSAEGKKEIEFMVNEITTNKTDFFRENAHFEFLKTEIFPSNNYFKIWSAGCSTGEEPYTLAMLLNEQSKRYDIFASDLSTDALKSAKDGIFSIEKVKDIPEYLIKKYFVEKKINTKTIYEAKDTISKNITFAQVNFQDNKYNITSDFDIIFFRNVLIYFKPLTQISILKKLISHLKPGGYLFIGHSEAIYDKSLPIKNVNPSVYLKIG